MSRDTADAHEVRLDVNGIRQGIERMAEQMRETAPASSETIRRTFTTRTHTINPETGEFAPIQEDPMPKTDRHDELVALLTEIRDRLPELKREEAFVEMYPAAVGHNLRHWKHGAHTVGVDCSCGPEKVSHEPAPADDLPGEPVEPGDLRAGDRVAFTWMGERMTGNLVSDQGGDVLCSDTPDSEGFVPSVVVNGGWRYGISDVRLIERAPREDEDPGEALEYHPAVHAVRSASRAIPHLANGERPDPLPGLPEARDLVNALGDAGWEVVRFGEGAHLRAEKAEAERDEWREVAARYEDGRDKWQAKWRESDEARERAEAALADERDRHDATITERDALRERLDALRADVEARGRVGIPTYTHAEILRRDDERAKGGQR